MIKGLAALTGGSNEYPQLLPHAILAIKLIQRGGTKATVYSLLVLNHLWYHDPFYQVYPNLPGYSESVLRACLMMSSILELSPILAIVLPIARAASRRE